MQWVRSIEAIQAQWPALPESYRIEVYYEALLEDSRSTLDLIFDFLGLEVSEDFFSKMPFLYAINSNKWKAELSEEEIELIKPILSPNLETLGFLRRSPW